MDISQIQIGLDVATALSVIGAAYAFMRNNAKENKKDKEVRLREFNVKKLSEIIQFLNKKTHESITIIEKINSTINYQGINSDLLFFCKKWDDTSSFPKKYSIINHMLKLENEVLLEIKLYLVYHPYLVLLSTNTKNNINTLIKHIDTILNLYLNAEMEHPIRLSEEIFHMQTTPNFSRFLIDRDIISTDIIDNGDMESYFRQEDDVMSKFNKLEKQKQSILKVNYLKERIEIVNKYSDKWQSIPDKIESTIKSLSKESYILIKS